ncbi:MAG: SMP-30/gluconolactonase/LRE family protein [Pseudomonadota bacterium]
MQDIENAERQLLQGAEPLPASGPLPVACLLGEGATWSAARGELLWTDIESRRLWSFNPASSLYRDWPMPGRLGSFALTADASRLLAAFDHYLAWLDLGTGDVTPLVEFDHGLKTRANDGRCDRQGNFVFGTFDEVRQGAPAGSWYRYTAAGVLQPLALPPVFIPNGIAFSLDGQRLYFCDSMQGLLQRARYNAATGEISDIQPFAQVTEGEPDGATVDADDCYWSALWGAGAVQRYRPDGSEAERVALNATQPSCLAFGGPALDTLYVTSARVGLSAEALAKEPEAGHVWHLPTALRGVPEALFGQRALIA